MKKAFTLIELMIVISVIGLLSAIAISKFTDINKSAKVANVQGNLENLRTAIGIYYVKTSSYPDIENNEDLESIINLGYKFTEFYSRSTMPETPSSDTTSETNNVVSDRDNTGGWLYYYDEGEIYANLENGTYTGYESTEIWEEEDESATEIEELTSLGSTFEEISSAIISLMETLVMETGKYGRTWGDYRYTDLGLDPEEWAEAIDHIYYKPSGSTLLIEPEDGYTFIVTDSDGNTRELSSTLNWNLIYDDSDGNWYYHTVDEDNIIDISTLQVVES
ncbi:type IV pilin protein [Ilyobacter polytropus]|uniref:Uncharacterized protein n=1 Tax=Ilyobacter polytropus (strain ATCC 51220 / DSM 2926 / LMG 16218 / CuHBu1) TaxID=572544 RepID=E3HC13_ILYPC|nr:type II secretion system protein [Ilyobacter polytropus]ADO84339.1 hypothetical protein Ilyop_2581 [Ilyobacter polytropus DSM 2926]